MAGNSAKTSQRGYGQALRQNVVFSGPIDPPIRNWPVWKYNPSQKKPFPERLKDSATVGRTARLRPFSHHYAASQAGVSFELRRGADAAPAPGVRGVL